MGTGHDDWICNLGVLGGDGVVRRDEDAKKKIERKLVRALGTMLF